MNADGRTRLNRRPEGAALAEHREQPGEVRLRELFAQGPGRAERYVVRVGDLRVDYSRPDRTTPTRRPRRRSRHTVTAPAAPTHRARAVPDASGPVAAAGGAEEPTGPGAPTAVLNDVRVPAEYNHLLFDAESVTSILGLTALRPQERRDHLFR